MRSLAASTVKDADPADLLIERVGQVILDAGPTDRDSYYYRLLLNPMHAGMNTVNAKQRVVIVAAKLRHAAADPAGKWMAVDISRLTTDLDDSDQHFAIIAAHYLARMLLRARELAVPSRELLDRVGRIPGEIGERLTCRVLALAEDIPLDEKIDHVTRRLASQTATGDDKDLIDAVFAADPDPSLLPAWTDALGVPTPPSGDPTRPPQDWRKAWRWSAILPEHLLTAWHEQINAVRDLSGPFDTSCFSVRLPRSWGASEQTPYAAADLSSMTTLEAARMIAAWRPPPEGDNPMITARALARTLRTVITAAPRPWAADAVAVVDALREPIYVLEYLRALTESVNEVGDRAEQIIVAVQLAQTERWIPSVLSNDRSDYEPDWNSLDETTIEPVAKLAYHNAPFADKLDIAWSWALATVDTEQTEATTTLDAAVGRAIASTRGRGFQAVLALAAWEYRNAPVIRAQFIEILDTLIEVQGQAGQEYRVILAHQRPLLEHMVPDWLDRQVEILFRGDSGPDTVDLTLESASGTPWLRRTLREEIIAAALRGTENAIVNMLIGALNRESGYDINSIITALRSHPTALFEAAGQMAELVQDTTADDPVLGIAVDFWGALLDADRNTVPDRVLRACGRWSYVEGLSDSVWSSLTLRTLERTAGVIDFAIEVADRSKSVPVPSTSTKILLLLQNHGDPWKHHHIAGTAVDALRTLSATRPDENFHALRAKVIQLGYDDAAYVTPYEDPHFDETE